MKMQAIYLLLIGGLFFPRLIFSQVNNDNLINYYAEIYALEWNVNNDSDEEEPSWKFLWRMNSPYNLSCSDNNYSNGYWCYKADDWYREYPKKKMVEENNKPTTDKLNYTFFAHENDGAHDCFFDYDLFYEDNNGHCRTDELAMKQGKPCQWNNHPYSAYNNWSKGEFRTAWRYSAGVTGFDPLDFGIIAAGRTKYHDNSNRGGPTSGTGYGNLWNAASYGYKSSTDVTYVFQITEPMRVTISTDHSQTNYDTYIHLMATNSDFRNSALFWYNTGNDNGGSGSKSVITRDLCAGYYYIVVEGASGSASGDFRLSVSAQSRNTLTAGSISLPPTTLCEGAEIPLITGTNASSSCPGANLTYRWYKNNRLVYTGPNPDYDDPGRMETSSLTYRRDVTDGRYTLQSNTITINYTPGTPNAGAISFSGTSQIPAGTDPGRINSTTNASATPGISALYWQRRIGLNGQWVTVNGAVGQSYDIPQLNFNDDVYYQRCVRSTCGQVACTTPAIKIDIVPANGVIEGYVTTQGNSPVSGVRIDVKRITAVSGGSGNFSYPEVYTDVQGKYRISGLYYGPSNANFEVRASKTSASGKVHSITPAFRPVPLSTNDNEKNNIDFTDQTSFAVTGRITQPLGGRDCPVEGVSVQLLKNGQPAALQVTTNASGDYAITVSEQGRYTIRPEFLGHSFDPPTIANLNVIDNRPNQNFTDTQTRRVRGFALSGCGAYLGRLRLQVESVDPCQGSVPIIKWTDSATGYYELELPARAYTIRVTDYEPAPGTAYEENRVKGFFGEPQQVDLTDEDQQLDFTYHPLPVVEISGLPSTPDCGGFGEVVLEQGRSYPLLIKIWEETGVNGCLVDTGTVIINDQIGDKGDEPLLLDFKGGTIVYELKAGNPNIIEDYLKNISVNARDTFEQSARNIDNLQETGILKEALVTGARPRGQASATVSPQIPLLILRDPPGDASYSYVEQSRTTEVATRYYALQSSGDNKWGQIKTGAAFGTSILGLETESAFWGIAGGSYEVRSTNVNINEAILSITNTEYFKTSDNPDIASGEGDVFIGAALSLLYSIADEVTFDENTCSVVRSKSFVIAPDRLESQFMFPESHIRDFVIPELIRLRDITTDPAEKADYDNQVSVWEQTLRLNEELKARAVPDPEHDQPYKFAGGGQGRGYSSTNSSTESITIEFGTEISEEIASEMGFEIAGNGLNGGLITTFKTEIGESETNTETTAFTSGFWLEDSDPGDEFELRVKRDPVYNTPVFDLISGETSCPHEPGTLARDAVQLQAVNPVQVDIAPDGEAVFLLLAGNISESEEARSYKLRFNQTSNPYGAAVTIGGTPYFGPLPVDNLSAGTDAQYRVTVRRGDPSVYVYEGLEFELYSECDPEISAKLLLTAVFNSPCGDLTLEEPVPGWVVNQDSDNQLRLLLKDYDLNNVDQVSVEYFKRGEGGLRSGPVLAPEDLLDSPFGTNIDWDVSGLTDGQYEIRLRSRCGINSAFTTRVAGRIDRRAPEVLGLPEPIDDNFDLNGDLIAVSFTEAVDCESLTNADLTIERLVFGNTIIPAELSCFNNRVVIVPAADLSAYSGEPVRITLSNVGDLYGNRMREPVSWVITLGGDVDSDDFDGDGVVNALDRCGGFNDYEDADDDGIPDGCDLCMETPNPGLSFDGSKDYLDLTSAAFDKHTGTIEYWFKPSAINAQVHFYASNVATENGFSGGSGLLEIHTGMTGSGKFIGVYQDGAVQTITGNTTLKAGKWYHLAFTFDRTGKAQLYVNGFLDAYQDADQDGQVDPGSDGSVDLGALTFADLPARVIRFGRPGLNLRYTRGVVDDLRIWNTVRTNAELSANRFEELIGGEPGLLTYYRFNDGLPGVNNSFISSVKDGAGSELDASPVGFDLLGNSSNFVIGAPVQFADTDADGILNGCEPDTDGDGIPNEYDLCQGADDLVDTDGDGVADGCDNCPETPNPGLDLDGVDDYIKLDGTPPIGGNSTFTIELWVNADGLENLQNQNPLYGEYRSGSNATGNYLAIFTDGSVFFDQWPPSSGWIASETRLTTGRWYHVAYVQDGAMEYIYIDGKLDVSREGPEPHFSATNEAWIGGRGGDFRSYRFFDGQVDEFRLWNVARTANQIASYMSRELEGTEQGLMVYLPFNEGVPDADNSLLTTVNDLSGNGYNGQLSGFDATGLESNWTNGGPVASADLDQDGLGRHCDPDDGQSEMEGISRAGMGQMTETAMPFTPENLAVRIFPNPALNEATLNYNLTRSGEVEIKLYDLMGRLLGVAQPAINQEAGLYETKIDVSGLATGTYLVIIRMDDQLHSERLMVVR